jgi:Mg-chelatase subunit ChlD
VIIGDRERKISQVTPIEELSGKLKFTSLTDKLMHAVLESDKDVIEEGKMIENALNQGIGSFTPDLLFENLVKNYRMAEQIYGESLFRQLFGYEADYIKRNIKIPEFKKELKKRLQEKLQLLKKDELLDKDYSITERGIELASLIMYVEELDHITPKGIRGEKVHKKTSVYGEKGEVKDFKKGDRYKDIALRSSIRTAIRRGHPGLLKEDLKVFERQSRGEHYIIYALDASGSMRGDKIGTCKKAGIALAYKAIKEKDKVGLIIFGENVKKVVQPTSNFTMLLKEMVNIKASSETNIVETIKKSIELFPNEHVTKHLLLLTDALPTVGDKPEEETLKQTAIAASNGITISVVGINLDDKGKKFGQKIVEIGKGRFYVVRNLEELDKIILEDYYAVV